MLILLGVLALVVWPLLGPAWALLVVCAALLAQLRRQRAERTKLLAWLRDPRPETIPDSFGDWEEAYVLLARSLKSQREQQRDLSAALTRFRQAAAAVPDGMVILDDHGAIQWCNPAAERHLGIDLARDAGQHVTYFVRVPSFTAYIEADQHGDPLVLRMTRDGGRPAVLSVLLVPFGDRDRLLISRDVARIEAVETTRRDFVANVSHELRTPLTVVLGFLETIVDSNDFAPAVARPLALVREQAERMRRLVEDLLTLSRLESGDDPVADDCVDMKALGERLRNDAKVLSAGRHAIEFIATTDQQVGGSPDELLSACGNLVTNAVRYTPSGGSITIAWRPQGASAVFEVIDTGIGIEAEHLPRITERFYRVDRSRSRGTGGTGLGLAIVKHVATRHGARLDIDSEPGKGSRFAIVFPPSRLVQSPARTADEACHA